MPAIPNDPVPGVVFGAPRTAPDGPAYKKGELTQIDLFDLAKQILTWCALLGFIVALARIGLSGGVHDEASKEVWSFASAALFGIATTVIGFYFGSKTDG